jgi:hypothetical protein
VNDLPDWWTDGSAVDMTKTGLVDVEMIEDREWDREWRLCLIPASGFDPCFADPDFMPLSDDNAESVRRFGEIRAWIGSRPIAEAYATAPVFAVLEATHLHILDGWHRTAVGMRAGESALPAVVSIGDSLREPRP